MGVPSVKKLKGVKELYIKHDKKWDIEIEKDPSKEEGLREEDISSSPIKGSSYFPNSISLRSIYQASQSVIIKGTQLLQQSASLAKNTYEEATGKTAEIIRILGEVDKLLYEKPGKDWIKTILELGKLAEEAQLNKEPKIAKGKRATEASRLSENIMMLMAMIRMALANDEKSDTNIQDEAYIAYQTYVKKLEDDLNQFENEKDYDIRYNSGRKTVDTNPHINLNLKINNTLKELAFLSNNPIYIEKAYNQGLLNFLPPLQSKWGEISSNKDAKGLPYEHASPWGLQNSQLFAAFELKYRQSVTKELGIYLDIYVEELDQKTAEEEAKRKKADANLKISQRLSIYGSSPDSSKSDAAPQPDLPKVRRLGRFEGTN